MSTSSPQLPEDDHTPTKPERSLPGYDEPTPEVHRKMSREEEAEFNLGTTVFTGSARTLLLICFLFTIISVPTLQLIVELRAREPGQSLPMFGALKLFPSWSKIRAIRSASDAWNLIPHPAEIKTTEKSLEKQSVVAQWLRPGVQSFLTGTLGAGNEQVIVGRDGWLFYRPDVEYITGAPFLDPAHLKQRAHAADVQPDPFRAIADFRDRLAQRGITLIVVPMPVKPCIEGTALSSSATTGIALNNRSFDDFKARLTDAGIRFVDPVPFFLERKAASGNAPLYLQTDTHWRPETMRLFAQNLVVEISDAPIDVLTTPLVEKQITAQGDIVPLLGLPPQQKFYPPQTVPIHQVTAGNGLWRSSPDAEVLLLGDSFANIFSLDALGWGESAGLAEHLSRALGRPVDCILRNSDGAFATREILHRELARGRDRLAGKKYVIWEFASRELAIGDWKLLDMTLGTPQPSQFFSPAPGTETTVTGTVSAISTVPRPGTVPYKDHILTMHLVDLEGLPADKSAVRESLVCLWSMRDQLWTPAARLRPGDRVTVRLRPWSDVSAQYEKINRSELDDPALLLEEPTWGELVK